jgi:hypothetical protein
VGDNEKKLTSAAETKEAHSNKSGIITIPKIVLNDMDKKITPEK